MTKTSLHPWVLVALLWGAALLNYLDRQVVFSVFPLLQRDLGANSFQQGLIGTVFLVCYGLVSPFGGYTADRIGRVRVILGSLILWSIGTWATGHVTSITQMLCARALIGASEAFYLPAALALIADRHGPRTRSLPPAFTNPASTRDSPSVALGAVGWATPSAGDRHSTSWGSPESRILWCCWSSSAGNPTALAAQVSPVP